MSDSQSGSRGPLPIHGRLAGASLDLIFTCFDEIWEYGRNIAARDYRNQYNFENGLREYTDIFTVLKYFIIYKY